ERDLRRARFLLADRPDAIEPGGAAADDQVSGRHHRASARPRPATIAASVSSTWAVRSAAKGPIQSTAAASSNVIAWVGQASAHAGAPPQRLHLKALVVSTS